MSVDCLASGIMDGSQSPKKKTMFSGSNIRPQDIGKEIFRYEVEEMRSAKFLDNEYS